MTKDSLDLYNIPQMKKHWFETCATIEEVRNMPMAAHWWHAMEETYSAKFRHFHDLYLVADMTFHIGMATQGALIITAWESNFLDLLCFFSFFDYNPRNTNHFADSADSWIEFADGQFFSQRDIEHGADYILSLKDHNKVDHLSDLLQDAAWNQYSEGTLTYENMIYTLRKEYDFLNDLEWREYRAKALMAIKSRPHIYNNPKHGLNWDKIARENIDEELKQLQSLGSAVVALT